VTVKEVLSIGTLFSFYLAIINLHYRSIARLSRLADGERQSPFSLSLDGTGYALEGEPDDLGWTMVVR